MNDSWKDSEVSIEEEKSLRDRKCPDCGCWKFLQGPRGEGAVNIECYECSSRFWIGWPFPPHRLNSPSPKRRIANAPEL